jgi:hypothetical protein
VVGTARGPRPASRRRRCFRQPVRTMGTTSQDLRPFWGTSVDHAIRQPRNAERPWRAVRRHNRKRSVVIRKLRAHNSTHGKRKALTCCSRAGPSRVELPRSRASNGDRRRRPCRSSLRPSLAVRENRDCAVGGDWGLTVWPHRDRDRENPRVRQFDEKTGVVGVTTGPLLGLIGSWAFDP